MRVARGIAVLQRKVQAAARAGRLGKDRNTAMRFEANAEPAFAGCRDIRPLHATRAPLR